MRSRHFAVLLALTVLTGCVGKAVNQATLYQPVTGVIEMDVKVPAGETVSSVQFQVNDKVVGTDDGASGSGTYSAEVDTTNLPVDTLAKLAAVGVRPDGTTVVLKENYILVESDPSATDTGATPEPLASSDNSNPDAAPANVDPTSTGADTPASAAAGAAYRGITPTPRPTARPKARVTSRPSSKRKVTIIHL